MKDFPQQSQGRDPSKPVWTLPGFHGKARVATIFGDLPIEALRRRDELKTPSGRYLQVEWVDKIHLDSGFLAGAHDAQPVLISRNAFGPGRPKTDIMLSPAQDLLVPGQGPEGAPRSARSLADKRPGVQRRALSGLTYYLFHCGQNTPVSVEGLWCPTSP